MCINTLHKGDNDDDDDDDDNNNTNCPPHTSNGLAKDRIRVSAV
jgi:hypothetical protein